MRITFISDTHTKHRELSGQLPGGTLLLHAGDLMNSGRDPRDIYDFCSWFEKQDYMHKIFIAGNHDRMFETQPDEVMQIIHNYDDIFYLQDESIAIEGAKIYGSPWQPEFYNWAFNLPRRGEELERVWADIPEDIDILITHGPPQGHLDISGPPYNEGDLGCELLRVRVDQIKPKIHVFGHIHGSYGYKFHNGTHFINAAVLTEQYQQLNAPLTVDWDPETNELTFI